MPVPETPGRALRVPGAGGGGGCSMMIASGAPPEDLPYLGRIKSRLACQKRSTTRGGNLNAHITDPLDELAEIYDDVLGPLAGSATGVNTEQYKAKQHTKVSAAIKELDFTVTSVQQISHLWRSESSSSRAKVAEIINTGKLQKLEELKSDKRVVALKDLTTVWGIGADTARKLYDNGKGVKSVEELRERVASGGDDGSSSLLTAQQLIGLRHHAEFQQRMPRAEAGAIGAFVSAAAEEACPGCSVTLAGSYRRGKETCGDIDVLIAPTVEFVRSSSSERRHKTGPGAVGAVDDILPTVLATLRERGVLTADLTKTKGFKQGERSYMGVARLPPGVVLPGEEGDAGEQQQQNPAPDAGLLLPGGSPGLPPIPPTSTTTKTTTALAASSASPVRVHRRIDIKVYLPEELPFALLYFTGSGYFNRSMRWWAKRKGLSLNDKGFFRETSNPNSHVRGDFTEEADVFRYLNLAYVAPADRSI